MYYVWLLVSNGLAAGQKIFQESTVCGLGECDWALALWLWERVGGVMKAGRSEKEM